MLKERIIIAGLQNMRRELCITQKVKRLQQLLDSFIVVCFIYHCMLYVDEFLFIRGEKQNMAFCDSSTCSYQTVSDN